MRKVVRIISRLCISGPIIHVTLLSKYFTNKDWHTTLVTGVQGENEGDMTYVAKQYGVDPVVIPELGREISPLNDLKVLVVFLRMFWKDRPDIVHTHQAKAGTVGRIAAKIAGVPRIYHTFHGNVFSGYFSPLKSKIFIIIERFLALLSTKIIAISEQQKSELLKYKITPERKIVVIPLGFDFSRLLPIDTEGSLKKIYNIPPKQTTIGIIGRLTHIKNHRLFFDIVEKVLLKTKNVHFLVIGDGELGDELKQLSKDKGLESSVTFTGFISDLKMIYGSLDIVLLTSLNEGTPVSLLEAMACEKLVITTRVGGVVDFIRHGESGFIFDFSPQDFANVICMYIDDPGRFNQIRKSASKEILEKYDKQRLLLDIEKLYTE